MELQQELLEGVLVVTLPGDHLDASNSEAFKSAMAPILENQTKVVLDLCHLKFVDSSGLGAMLSCLRKLGAAGGDLKVCNLTKQVRLLFELVRMQHIIQICADRKAALAALKG